MAHENSEILIIMTLQLCFGELFMYSEAWLPQFIITFCKVFDVQWCMICQKTMFTMKEMTNDILPVN